jgi:glycogen synthase
MWNDRCLDSIEDCGYKELRRTMKVLLIGPYPPPYGGISVHVELVQEDLRREGIDCRVICIDRHAPESDRYIRIKGGLGLARIVFNHARKGWIPHVHINGHNAKGWLIALTCGIAGHCAAARLLTIHSGMTPAFLAGGRHRKHLARLSCGQYQRVISVSQEIREALETAGVPSERMDVLPAYMEDSRQPISPPHLFKEWLQSHTPCLSTAISFRPEYGFDLLLAALLELRRNNPAIGLLVMGGGEDFEAAKKQVAARGLEDSILLAGEVPHALCLLLIANSDGFVRPTRADGDSNAVREALATGIPVVASDICHRPSGTILFRNGDAADLAIAIANCLRRESRTNTECRTEGGRQRLIELYTRAAQA